MVHIELGRVMSEEELHAATTELGDLRALLVIVITRMCELQARIQAASSLPKRRNIKRALSKAISVASGFLRRAFR